MTVTFLTDNIKMGRTGISYPFVLEVPEFGQIAGRVTETQRGATQVAFPSGVKAASTTAGFILYEFQKFLFISLLRLQEYNICFKNITFDS